MTAGVGIDPEQRSCNETEDDQRGAEQRFQGSDGEVTDQVVDDESAGGVANVLDQEREHHTSNLQVALLAAVNRRHRHVVDHRAKQVQVQQYVGLEKEPLVDLSVYDLLSNGPMHRRVAVGWIEDVPVTRR